VWLLRRGAGPDAEVLYLPCVKAGDPSWPLGDISKIECPDPEQSGEFETVEEYRGARDRATIALMGRYSSDLSTLLDIAREGCVLDVQVHIGPCQTRNDYISGWKKIVSFPAAYLTQYALENFGAIESGDQNPTNENVDVSAREMYEIKWLAFSEQAKTTVVREVVGIDVCDAVNCGGACGVYSDGCSKVFAVQLGTGATPGTLPSVVYSSDGGATWAATDIDTMFSNETPGKPRCMGQWLVVPGVTSNSLHYAPAADILEGVEVWAETITGFVAGGEPRAIYVGDSTHAWAVGTAGYVYFFSDPQTAVSVQDAGVATGQTLYAVDGYGTQIVVAVGGANAIIATENGANWAAITGPALKAGVQLNAVKVLDANRWFIGYADGDLWYTLDGGDDWTEIVLPGSPTNIYAIATTNDNRIAYVGGVVGANGRIWRSTAGGADGTWYMLPEGAGAIPTNSRINDLGVCEKEPNVVWGAGLNGTDGFIVKAA
jgi:hypothetical protein